MDLGEIYCPWKHIYTSVFGDEDSKPRDLVGQMRSLKKAPWNLTRGGGGQHRLCKVFSGHTGICKDDCGSLSP